MKYVVYDYEKKENLRNMQQKCLSDILEKSRFLSKTLVSMKVLRTCKQIKNFDEINFI